MREITLTKGRVALVDDEDFARFGHLKWTTGSFGGRIGYAYRTEFRGGKWGTVLLHREILGATPGQMVDHRNRDTFDNRRANLRFASRSENARNCYRRSSNSGFIGVSSQTPGTWRGRVSVVDKSYYTPTFKCPLQAALARDILASRLHGEYAVLNFNYQLITLYLKGRAA